MTAERPFIYQPPTTPLDILYQDDDICVVDKPAGLLSVAGKGPGHDDCLMARLQEHDPDILLIHRLDCATSGVMIFARNKMAQKKLSRQFEKRATQKTYLAEIYGQPDQENGTINAAMRCDWERRPMQIIDPVQGRKAITHWQILEKRQKTSIIRLTPETGRSHQLRVHMQYLGHPIIGDAFYADDTAYHMVDRLHLHAAELQIYHPSSNEIVQFAAICPFYTP